MGITVVGERGTKTQLTGSGASESVTLSSSCTAGNTVILVCAARDTDNSGMSVTDSRGNTWTIDVGPLNTGNNQILIASTRQNAGTLVSGDTITVNWNTAPGQARGIIVEEISGLVTASYVDKTANNGNASAVTSGDSGTTATTTQASELAVAAFCLSVNMSSFTPDGAYSQWTTSLIELSASDFNKTLISQYKILSATGTQVCSISWPTSAGYQGIIVTYKAAVTTISPSSVVRTRAIGTAVLTREQQVAVPSADSVDNSWTDQAGGTSLAVAIDETTASDADYIRSPIGPSNSGCRVKLATLTDPVSSVAHEIHWRTGKDFSGGPQINMTVKLRQGGGDSLGAGTLIASFSRNNVSAFSSYVETLSGAEADSITNYADLYLEFFANQV